MKIKIIIMCIFILLLSLSAVSADENVTLDDSAPLEISDSDIAEVGSNQLDIDIEAPDELYYMESGTFSYDYYFAEGGGSIDMYVNDEKVDSNKLISGSSGGFTHEYFPEKFGKYDVSFRFGGNDFYAPFEKNFSYNVDDWILKVGTETKLSDTPENDALYVFFPADGNADVTVDSHKYSYKIEGGYNIDVPVGGLSVGKHNITVNFKSSDKKFKSKTLKQEFVVYPGSNYVGDVGYGSGRGINFYAPEGTEGTVNIKIDNEDFKTIDLHDTRSVALDKLPIGDHSCDWIYKNGNLNHSDFSFFKVVPNVNVSDYYFVGKDTKMSLYTPVVGNMSVILNDEVIYTNPEAMGLVEVDLKNLENENDLCVLFANDQIDYTGWYYPKYTDKSPIWQMNVTAPSDVFRYADEVNLVVDLPEDYGGNIKVLVDGSDKYLENVCWHYEERNVKTALELSKLKQGKHEVYIEMYGDDFYIPLNKTITIETHNIFVDCPDPLMAPNDDTITLQVPSDAKGNVKFYLDGKLVQKGKTSDSSSLMYYMMDNSYGWHTLKVVYDDSKYGHFEDTKKIYYDYQIFPLFKSIFFQEDFYYGNDNSIIYYTVYEFNKILTVKIGNTTLKSQKGAKGFVVCDISMIKPGNYTVEVSYAGDKVFPKKTVTHDLEIHPKPLTIVAKNANLYYGQYYSVKILSNEGKPLKGEEVTFKYNDGVMFDAKTDANGIAKFKLNFKPRNEVVTLLCKGAWVLKKVNIKHVVSLSTVKVKKSAKKLVLTATVKQGKTPIKKASVTFKFNGVKIKGKTNSKGVVKVTVKKSILNKLKVGKKIAYYATYGKDTVKKTVKVSR